MAVFDFDSTLVFTEGAEMGRKKWLMHYDNLFPYKTDEIGKSVRAWWSHPESLNTEIFHHPSNEYVRNIYKNHLNNNDFMVMLTGRLESLEPGVKKILDMHDYKFDRYYFNPKGFNTEKYKVKKVEDLMKEFKSIEKIDFYDDRGKHITFFRDWAKIQSEIRKIEINIHHIK